MLVSRFLISVSFLASSIYSVSSAPTFDESVQELQARQGSGGGGGGGGGAAEVIQAAVEIAINIATSLADAIKQDDNKRSEFTQQTVGKMHDNDPSYSYIIVHTEHTTDFKGQQGKDWDHRHQEFDIQVGGTIGYEIYTVKEGTFTLKGDGGYLNWAFIGNIKRDDNTLTISK